MFLACRFKKNYMKKHLVALFHHLPPSTRTAILLAIFSSLFVAILYALERRIGFNIADEGFLWYGAQRVMQGEVPIRDFMAYDLGRYYFCAAIMGLMGDDGILALRFATALFQCIGLFLALLVLVRAWQNANAFLVCLTSITLVLWMLPWQRLFDLTLSIVLITTLALVIEKPSSHRWFWAGLTLGVVAIFGRNHGVYGVTASLAALVYLAVVQRENSLLRSLSWWSAGLVSGYLPMFAALYFVPGLAHAFWESIAFLLQQKETNLPLPVPWPWRVPFENLSWRGAITPALLGCFFLALPLFCIFSVAFVVHSSIAKTKVNALFVATALLSAPYAHYAFSRADAEHLALGIFPLL